MIANYMLEDVGRNPQCIFTVGNVTVRKCWQNSEAGLMKILALDYVNHIMAHEYDKGYAINIVRNSFSVLAGLIQLT